MLLLLLLLRGSPKCGWLIPTSFSSQGGDIGNHHHTPRAGVGPTAWVFKELPTGYRPPPPSNLLQCTDNPNVILPPPPQTLLFWYANFRHKLDDNRFLGPVTKYHVSLGGFVVGWRFARSGLLHFFGLAMRADPPSVRNDLPYIWSALASLTSQRTVI